MILEGPHFDVERGEGALLKLMVLTVGGEIGKRYIKMGILF